MINAVGSVRVAALTVVNCVCVVACGVGVVAVGVGVLVAAVCDVSVWAA